MSEYDRLWREINGLKKNVRGLSQPQLAFSTVEDGYVTWRDADGNPRMRIGLQGDGTQTIKHVAGPKPPAPSDPVVTPDLSTLLVAWDGTFTGPRPGDWDRVDVHVSQDENFIPSTVTLRGSILSQDGGDLTLRVTGGTWHARLVAVSKAEVHSDPSSPVTVTVEGITDRVKADIEASEGRLSEAQQKALEELAELERKLAGVGEKAEEATLRARSAHNVAVTAQSAADDALAKYGPLDQRTVDAQKAAKDAQAKAEEAYSTAEGASEDVAKAKADAEKAKQEALAAKTSASQAQTKADQARTAATQAQSDADDALAKYGPLDERTIDAQARADQAKTEAERAHSEAKASKSLADAAKKRADDAYALAQSKLSAEEVEKRILQSANGKNQITVSRSAPGSAKGIAGDLWRRVDSNGHVFAEWTHDGKSWKPALIRSDMITNLDVHKLTVSGSARVEDAVIEKLWVDGLVGKSATFQQMTVASGNLIPNGDFSQGLEHWKESPSWEVASVDDLPGITTAVKATGSVTNAYEGPTFPLDSSRRYRFEVWMKASKPGSRFYLEIRNQDGAHVARNQEIIEGPFTTLGSYAIGNSLVPTSWAKAVIEFDVRDGSTSGRIATLYFNHSNGSVRDADVYMTGIKLYPVDGVVQLVDGQVTAPKITASQELTAKIAKFLTIRAGQIEADAIDGMTITGATFQTGKSNPRVVMDRAGIRAFDTRGTQTLDVSSRSGDVSMIGDLATGQPGTKRTIINNQLWTNVPYLDWLGESVYSDGSGIRIGRDMSLGESADITYAEIPTPSNVVTDDDEETGEDAVSLRPALVVRGPGDSIHDQATLTFWGSGSGTIRVKEGEAFTIRPQSNRGDYIRLERSGSITLRSLGGAQARVSHTGTLRLQGAVNERKAAEIVMQTGVTLRSQGRNSVFLTTGSGKAYITVGYGDRQTNLYEAVEHRFLGGPIFYFNSGTVSYNANMFLGESGQVWKGSASSRRYKVDIQDYDVPDSLLDVPFRTWVDKAEAEEAGTTEGLPRLPGLIAEEVAEVDPTFVIYDQEGRPDALHGDRIGMATLTLLRRQRDRITDLENRLIALEKETN